MARVKLETPDKFIFSTRIKVRIDDINYGGHLSNDKVLSIVHEARLRFLNSLGFSELDLAGVSIIMADVAAIYKSEGFQGDELEIEIAVKDFTTMGFDIFYKILNLTTGKDLALVKTGIVCFDYKARKVQKVPKAFLKLFK